MSKSASELTKQFRKQTELLHLNASPQNSWVSLQKNRDLRVININNIKVPFGKSSVPSPSTSEMGSILSDLRVININDIKVPSRKSSVPLSSTFEMGSMLSDCKITEAEHKKMSDFKSDYFLKLHELCSSSSSIEMFRIYAATYPWSVRQRDQNGDIPLHVAIKRDDPSLIVIYFLLEKWPEGSKVKDR